MRNYDDVETVNPYLRLAQLESIREQRELTDTETGEWIGIAELLKQQQDDEDVAGIGEDGGGDGSQTVSPTVPPDAIRQQGSDQLPAASPSQISLIPEPQPLIPEPQPAVGQNTGSPHAEPSSLRGAGTPDGESPAPPSLSQAQSERIKEIDDDLQELERASQGVRSKAVIASLSREADELARERGEIIDKARSSEADNSKAPAAATAGDLPPKSTQSVKSSRQRQPAPIMRRRDLVGAIMRVTGGEGLSPRIALDLTGEKANRAGRLRGLFTQRGQEDLDDLATLLREDEGFNVRDGDHLAEMIRDASDGARILSVAGAQEAAERAANKEYRASIRQRASDRGIKTVAVKFDDIERAVLDAETSEAEADEAEARAEREAIIAESHGYTADDLDDNDVINALLQDAAHDRRTYFDGQWIDDNNILAGIDEEGAETQGAPISAAADTQGADGGIDRVGGKTRLVRGGDTAGRQQAVQVHREGGSDTPETQPQKLDLTGQTNAQAAADFTRQQAGEPELTREQIDRERDGAPFSLDGGAGGAAGANTGGTNADLFTPDGRATVAGRGMLSSMESSRAAGNDSKEQRPASPAAPSGNAGTATAEEQRLVESATPERSARTLAEAKEQAKAFVGKRLTNQATGLVGTVSNGNLRKMTSAKAVLQSSSPEEHALAVANVDKLFTNAVLDHSHTDRDGEATIAAIHRYVAPMLMPNGEVLAVKMTVKETTGPNEPNPIYSIETIDVEKPALRASDTEIERGIGVNDVATSTTGGLTINVVASVENVKRAARTVQPASDSDGSVAQSPRQRAGESEGDNALFSKRAEGKTPEDREFAETERAYGGKPAYEKAKKAGRTKLTFRQWVQVRTKAFKQWFGDWEDLMLKNRIMATDAINTSSEGLSESGAVKALRDEAVSTYKGPDEIRNADTGETIRIAKSGIENSLQHGMKKEKRAVVSVLDKLLENAVFVTRDTTNMRSGVRSVETFAHRVSVDGKPFVARIVVRELNDGRRFYDHELTSLESERPAGKSGGSEASFGDRQSEPRPTASLGNSVLERVLAVNPDAVSKVVDPETGEPRVVFHATWNDFEAFDPERAGENTDGIASSEEWATTARMGFWFSDRDVREDIGAPRSVPAFLSLQNPKPQGSLKWLAGRAIPMDGNGSAAEYREALQADGYDGLTIEDEEFGGISFVAFSPNQIKSATANSGAFSPADDSILRSKTAGTSHPSTVADVRAGVAETLGQGIADALEKTGILKIHATPETLPENVRKKAGHDPRFPDTLNVNLDAVLAGRHLGNDVSSLLNSMTFELFD